MGSRPKKTFGTKDSPDSQCGKKSRTIYVVGNRTLRPLRNEDARYGEEQSEAIGQAVFVGKVRVQHVQQTRAKEWRERQRVFVLHSRSRRIARIASQKTARCDSCGRWKRGTSQPHPAKAGCQTGSP